MKRCIIMPAILFMISASVMAQAPAISDSVGVPSGASAPSIVSSPAPITSGVEMGTPIVSQPSSGSYVGDLPSTGSVVTSDSGVVSGGEIISGDGMVGGGCQERRYGQPDLFYNFYTQGHCNRANAQMYMSPLPVPPNVGHTFFTYQPFYPHEYLYGHTNKFHNYYDNGRGTNRTRVNYSTNPVRTAVSNLYWNKIRIPR